MGIKTLVRQPFASRLGQLDRVPADFLAAVRPNRRAQRLGQELGAEADAQDGQLTVDGLGDPVDLPKIDDETPTFMRRPPAETPADLEGADVVIIGSSYVAGTGDLLWSVDRGEWAAAAKRGFSAERIVGIGIDTTASTPLPVDRNGKPLAMLPAFKKNLAAHAWLWKDHTSHAEAAEITEGTGNSALRWMLSLRYQAILSSRRDAERASRSPSPSTSAAKTDWVKSAVVEMV